MTRSAAFIWSDHVLAPGEDALSSGVAAVLRRWNLAGVALIALTPDDDPRLVHAVDVAGARLDSVALIAADGRPHVARARAMLRAARDHDLDLATSWLIGHDQDDIRAAAQAGCHGVVLIGGPVPVGEPGIVVAQADALADAPRVMVPRGGGCWHGH